MGVNKYDIFVDVINGSPLSRVCLLRSPRGKLLAGPREKEQKTSYAFGIFVFVMGRTNTKRSSFRGQTRVEIGSMLAHSVNAMALKKNSIFAVSEIAYITTKEHLHRINSLSDAQNTWEVV